MKPHPLDIIGMILVAVAIGGCVTKTQQRTEGCFVDETPRCNKLLKAPRQVDTLLWQCDASRGIAVRIPIEGSGIWHIVQTEGFDDWRIWSIELMEGPYDRPQKFCCVQTVADTEEIAHDFLVHSDDVEDSKTYSIQVRLHSDSYASVEPMAKLLRAGHGIRFVKWPKQ